MKKLSQDQITLVATSLGVAQEVFVNDMAVANRANDQRLRDQFERQVKGAEILRTLFECADGVTIHE